MWIILASVLLALVIIAIMVIKATGRPIMNKPTWKGGIISFFLGLLPIYLTLCLFGVMGEERDLDF